MNPGLSLFRFYLALCVLASHFVGPDIWGDGAVETFFCISGFLVTCIVNEQYAGRPFDYLFNRFLRIYPIYWACLTISILIVALLPAAAHQVNSALTLPGSSSAWLSQVAIFGLYAGNHPGAVRLLPPAWSLNVELYFYFVIGLVTAFRPRLTAVLCIVSFAISTLTCAKVLPLPAYGDPLGNAQPFFFGSLAYHLRDRLNGQRAPFILAAFAIAQLVPLDAVVRWQVLVSSVVAPFAVIAIWNVHHSLSQRAARFADLLGKLSYPIFLLHWVVAVPFVALGFHHAAQFAYVLPLTVALALLVHVCVERPLEGLRRRIRNSQSATTIGAEPLPRKG